MSDFEKLPRRVQDVIVKVRDGRCLCKTLRLKESGETEIQFYYEPGGKRVGPKSADGAVKSGFLKPAGDGLLGDEFSQTWRAA